MKRRRLIAVEWLATIAGAMFLVGDRRGSNPIFGPAKRVDADDESTFLNLRVSVEAVGAARQTTVVGPDGATATAPFTFGGLSDRGATRLIELLESRGQRRSGSGQAQAVEVLGDGLFAALLPDELETVYRQAFDAARQRDIKLRIELELDHVTADLPWEYLHDRNRASFLALSHETSVVRRLPVTDETRPQPPIDTVKVLVMGASPRGFAQLDIAGERARISRALEPAIRSGRIALHFASSGTLEELRTCLDSFQPHIFLFSGHGTWDNETEDGDLILETASGGHRRVTGRELGVLLVRSGLRLVQLNSCQTARSSQTDPFAGIAMSLLAQGVPAVMAMQYPIADEAASTFGTTFLRQFMASGSVDASLNDARIAMFTTQNRLEWGTPVLTSRVPVHQVLPLSSGPPAARPSERSRGRPGSPIDRRFRSKE